MNTPPSYPPAPTRETTAQAVMASMVDGLARLAAQAHPLHIAPRCVDEFQPSTVAAMHAACTSGFNMEVAA